MFKKEQNLIVKALQKAKKIKVNKKKIMIAIITVIQMIMKMLKMMNIRMNKI